MSYLQHRANGSGELSVDIYPELTGNIKAIYLHLNASGLTGTFLVSICSKNNDNDRIYIVAQSMETVADYVLIPDCDLPFTTDDFLRIEWGNEQNRDWFLRVLWR